MMQQQRCSSRRKLKAPAIKLYLSIAELMAAAEPRGILIRLLLTGDSDVGKSSILQRFSNDTFHASPTPTPVKDFQIKRIEIDGCSCELHVIAAAAHEEMQIGDEQGFERVCSKYLRGAMGVAVVYDITSEASFASACERMSYTRQVLVAV